MWIIIAIFWLIVAVIHLFLMIKHFTWSRRKHSSIEDKFSYGEVTGVPVAGGGHEAVEAINSFIQRLNRDNHQSNIAQSCGYAAGFVASLIGFALSLSSLF